ncbi:hypothetical protein PITC_010010 [Penicillium italicum]|uniref:F-box domain-containing protein n=1 Tax=Penicillium italicum TaxID=40296 RepID=A0A0A2LEW7_PENIT|nr:hypothetical protein PITC_010010 [Penicillium italicum]
MPALRSSSQDYACQISTNTSITHTKQSSAGSIRSVLNKAGTKYLSQDRQLSKYNSTNKSSPPAANIAPTEILLEIFSMLTPRDFDNARRTCSQWMRVSLNHKLLENMFKRAGWWDAWLQDRQTPRISRSDESEVWRMSRRFATECLLSGRKLNVEKPGFLTAAVVDFSSLSDSARRTSRRSRLQPLQMTEGKRSGVSTFSTSSCSNYLLLTTGCMIYIYSLLARKSRSTSATDFSDSHLALVSRISCPFDVISAAIDTSKPQFTIAALLCNRVGMICDLDMAWAKDSATKGSHPKSKMATSSRHFFYNICTVENPPRTVALCPGRPIVAFGCAAGIEIHSVNEKTRNEQRKHFTLPQASEILHFLPSSPETPNELRLISSLSGPGLHECKCPPSPSPSSSSSSTSSPKLDSKNNQFHFLADIQSFNRRRIPHAPSRSLVRATHCHHYRAVPINDGFHIMFIEPRTNLLCIGTDAPVGGPTSLTRAFVCIPPPFSNIQDGQIRTPPPSPSPSNTTPPPTDLPVPSTFTAGSDLRWGLRVVAAYGDRLVLYSIPLDVFNVIRKERELQGDGIMGASDLALDWYVDSERSRKRRESLVQNQNGDWEFLLSVSYRPTAMMWPFKIYGKEIGSVKGTVELSLQSSEGGVRVWAFGKDGKGTVLDVDTGDAPTRSLGVGSDGGLEDLGIVQKTGLGELQISRKRKFEEVRTGFAGRYGAGRHSADGVDVKPCAAGVHECLPQRDLNSLLQVSRDTRVSAEPLLYRSIHWDWKEPPIYKILLLLRTISERPKLAHYIWHVSFVWWDVESQGTEVSIPKGDLDWSKLMLQLRPTLRWARKVVRDAKFPTKFDTKWITRLFDGDAYAYATLLVSQLHNLRSLRLDFSFVLEGGFPGEMLHHALFGNAPPGTLSRFSKLEMADYGSNFPLTQFTEGISLGRSYQFSPWFHLPSLKTLEIWLYRIEGISIFPEEMPKTSLNLPNLRSLVIAKTRVLPGDINRLLSQLPSLKSLHVGMAYKCRATAEFLKEPECLLSSFKSFGRAIEHLSISMELLPCCAENFHTHEIEGGSQPFHGILKKFPKLKTASLPLNFLIGWDTTPFKLRDVLPSTLEALHIRADLWHTSNFVEFEMEVLEALESLMRHKQRGSHPSLKTFSYQGQHEYSDNKLAALGFPDEFKYSYLIKREAMILFCRRQGYNLFSQYGDCTPGFMVRGVTLIDNVVHRLPWPFVRVDELPASMPRHLRTMSLTKSDKQSNGTNPTDANLTDAN